MGNSNNSKLSFKLLIKLLFSIKYNFKNESLELLKIQKGSK